MKRHYFLIVFFISNTICFGQSDTLKNHIAKNTVFIEGLGNGILYSLNYSRQVINRNKFSSDLRVGLCYWPFDHADTWTALTEFTSFYGKRHKFEFGFGAIYSYGFNSIYDVDEVLQISSRVYLSIKTLGYAYSKSSGGLFLNGGILSLISIYEFNKAIEVPGVQKFIPVYFRVGVGYRF
jgi:hypothetical protein